MWPEEPKKCERENVCNLGLKFCQDLAKKSSTTKLLKSPGFQVEDSSTSQSKNSSRLEANKRLFKHKKKVYQAIHRIYHFWRALSKSCPMETNRNKWQITELCLGSLLCRLRMRATEPRQAIGHRIHTALIVNWRLQ